MPATSAYIQRFLEETSIGVYGTATSVAATSITDALRFQSSGRGENAWDGHWIWRPTTSGADRVKQATTVSTAALSHGGSNYSDTSETAYLITRPEWHPLDHILPLANRALEHCWQWWRTVLTVVPNGDGEASSVGGSDSGGTASRDTTAADVFDGEASIRFANSGANGYHQFAAFDAAANQPFKLAGWVRITSGTATVSVYDLTNSAEIETLSISGVGQPHYFELTGTFPSTCYSATVRVGGDESDADTNWDDIFLVWDPITQIAGPSWVKEWRTDDGENAFRLYKSRYRLFEQSKSGPSRAYDLELIDPSKYQLLNIPSAANPVLFELGRDLTWDMRPLIIEAKRAFADFGALSAWTDTSAAPTRLVVEAMKWLAAEERGIGNAGLYYARYLAEQRKVASLIHTPPPDAVSRGLAYQKLG